MHSTILSFGNKNSKIDPVLGVDPLLQKIYENKHSEKYFLLTFVSSANSLTSVYFFAQIRVYY